MSCQMHDWNYKIDSPNRGVCVIRLAFAGRPVVQARASRFGGLVK